MCALLPGHLPHRRLAPVAVGVNLDQVCVVDQSINGSYGHHFVRENTIPFGEGLVGGDDQATVLVTVSDEHIYQHVWSDKAQGGDLYKYLRHSHKKRKKQYGSRDKRGHIKNRISIDERPEVVAEKTRIGDWEIDTVIGKNHQGALVTIVDRVSKFTLIKKVDSKRSDVETEATISLLKPYLDKVLTITADNGKEFSNHQVMKQHLDADVYFAHPYHSWERGLNENTNGLIRQYFTKGSSFENITDEEVEKVIDRLNHRPRKTLGYRTPHEEFFSEYHRQAA